MTQALKGIQVLDFTHVLAGPIATNHLALQGADVIKVESAAGDTMRNYGGQAFADGLAPSFVSVNAGKRSIVLDLKRGDHLDIARRLVARADVVMENFRPGVMDRLGLGYDACRALRPDIVYCSVSGFGQAGPLKGHPAIDQIIQSMSGLMTLSGEAGSPSMRVGFPIVDTFTGLLAAFATTAALLERARTGQGQMVDVAMLDAALVMMVSVAGPCLAAGVRPRKQGNLGYSNSPTADTFPTASGEITLGVVRQDQFEKFCHAIERSDLPEDERFLDRHARQKNGAALRSELIATLARHTALEWELRLGRAGVAASAVREVHEALEHPQVAQRGLRRNVRLPDGQLTQVLGAGFTGRGHEAADSAPPPRLGEHTRQVLAELGCAPAEIEQLCA
ncbi:MAG: CoA transferase [Burkholderiales bacterium]|nr:CoA transferase [Burkholderiales bacterium]